MCNSNKSISKPFSNATHNIKVVSGGAAIFAIALGSLLKAAITTALDMRSRAKRQPK